MLRKHYLKNLQEDSVLVNESSPKQKILRLKHLIAFKAVEKVDLRICEASLQSPAIFPLLVDTK